MDIQIGSVDGEPAELHVASLLVDPTRNALEIVERKGLGHPDTLCDAAAEAFSRRLSAHYLARFGRILHHNVDKALLVAGRTDVRYGGGEWLDPIAIHLGGRAVCEWDGIRVPVEEIGRSAVEEALRGVRNLEPGRCEVHVHVHPVAADLQSLFDRRGSGVPLANDTSIGVGFAPLSRAETIALEIERMLNAEETKAGAPALGEDVKVLIVRRKNHLEITIATAMVARCIGDASAYRDAVGYVRSIAHDLAEDFESVSVHVNQADDPEGPGYLTLSGTSAESGDDGQVGRGNRYSGLITPMRPMTIEAHAGKNSITHVGKIYSVVADRIAKACAQLPDVRSAECMLVSCIGHPITRPQVVGLRLDGSIPDRGEITAVVRDELQRAPELWRDLLPHSS